VDVNSAMTKIRHGVSEIIGETELVDRLKKGIPLKVKYGADPSAPDLHLGHTVVLRKLRQLQELGHTVQFLIGDFTGMIGDPTGRSVTRPPLTPEQIQANAQTYKDQVFKILLPEQTEIVYNSTWCNAMNFSDVIRLSAHYTVARIIERDDFSKRFKEGRPIGLHEFLYPLIQGYDSVVLKSDIELCGTDQIFNCLVARSLQQDYDQAPEVIIAMPLLEGLDGVQKMSKSLGNYVGVTDPPKDMYGKVMSIPDALMFKYLELLTDTEPSDIENMKQDLETGKLHPRVLKASLAHKIVRMYHNQSEADLAAEEFDRVFKNSGLPEDIPEKKISTSKLKEGKLWIIQLLHESGLVTSKADAQRMLKQGAIQINQQKVTDTKLDVVIEDGLILQVGKRKFAKIRLHSE
jgi:tyrosyl-tRNA synthetase